MHRASIHAPRDLDEGASAVEAIVGNKFIPGLLDRYLGETGFAAQQTDTPRNPNQRDNPHEPVDDTLDHGTHGVFDDKATYFSPALCCANHRGGLATVGGLGMCGAAIAGISAFARRGRAAMSDAPGQPGVKSKRSDSRKDAVGTAKNLASHVWFTVADGLVTDVFYRESIGRRSAGRGCSSATTKRSRLTKGKTPITRCAGWPTACRRFKSSIAAARGAIPYAK